MRCRLLFKKGPHLTGTKRYEQAHYAHLSYTRSDVGPKPYGCGNYCRCFIFLFQSHSPCPQGFRSTPNLPTGFPRRFCGSSTRALSSVGLEMDPVCCVPSILQSGIIYSRIPKGPVPDAANYYWVDPDTVPNYIKLQRLLMTALVRTDLLYCTQLTNRSW